MGFQDIWWPPGQFAPVNLIGGKPDIGELVLVAGVDGTDGGGHDVDLSKSIFIKAMSI